MASFSKDKALVSILSICKNSEGTIRRCVESVLSQDYPNIEYIIQDGASRDRTLEIISEYQDEGIKLVSEPDSGGSEAYFRALCRCTGDVIGLCWADEEYLPGTVSWGVENLLRNPNAAAIYGDVYSTDINGNIFEGGNQAPPWDLAKFICWEIMPNYCGSFMRSECLKSSGFFEFTNSFFRSKDLKPDQTNCVMYDYFAKVGVKYPILYVPDFVGKFSVHKGQLSSTPSVLFSMIPTLFRSIDHLCNDPNARERVRALRFRAYAGVHLAMINSLIVNANAYDDAKKMLREALKYEPSIDRLSEVLGESFLYFITHDHMQGALDFVRIIADADVNIPGLKYMEVIALLELGHHEDALATLRDGLKAEPVNTELRDLEVVLDRHDEIIRAILNRMSTDNGCSKLMSQILPLMFNVKRRIDTPMQKEFRQVLGMNLKTGLVTFDQLLVSNDILYTSLSTPNFLEAMKKVNPKKHRLIEKTLATYLLFAVEQNAVELKNKLAEILFPNLKTDSQAISSKNHLGSGMKV